MAGSPRPTPRPTIDRSKFPEPSPLVKALRNSVIIAGFMKFLYGLAVGFAWMIENIVKPVTRPFWKTGLWLFNRYRWVWDRVVYTKSGRLSNPRAGLMVTATLLFLWFLGPIFVFVGDSILFVTTYGTETVYLTGSQEIDPAINLHNVKGCESEDCTPENALYYRVVDNNVNSAWAWLTHGHPFYPDNVAASSGNGFSKCTVTSYGVRWKFVTRNFEWYPFMLQAHCRSTGLGERVQPEK